MARADGHPGIQGVGTGTARATLDELTRRRAMADRFHSGIGDWHSQKETNMVVQGQVQDLDRTRLDHLLDDEQTRFLERHPRSVALSTQAQERFVGGVPMGWMQWWPTPVPLVIREASGAHLIDVDGHEYIDFCLGEGASMPGHSPPAVAAAVARQASQGISHLFPTEDALWVAQDLTARFGLPTWHFALSATDANRFVLRLLRALTGRQIVVVFEDCYHGTVDESLHEVEGELEPARRMIPFNDVAALEAVLSPGDVACVLAEPVMTNVGLVFPDPGFHDTMRELTRQTGTLLVIDETHTISAGPGGCTAAWSLEPDVITIGKAIGGGIPSAAYGFTSELGRQIEARDMVALEGTGGTLAGNALSVAATRATLEHVLTAENYHRTTGLAERFAAGVEQVVSTRALPWRTALLGCRAEYAFGPTPRTGAESVNALDADLSSYLRLYAINRGVILTPFLSNIALTCAETAEPDVDRHTDVFAEAVDTLLA
jgi:glutamate-1-semialdehyde 2,1-aminomutase